MNNCHVKPQGHVDIPGFLCYWSLSQVTVPIYQEKSGSLTFPKHYLCRIAIWELARNLRSVHCTQYIKQVLMYDQVVYKLKMC